MRIQDEKHALSEEKQASILNLRFPNVVDRVPRVLRAISGVNANILRKGRALDREPTLREAVRHMSAIGAGENRRPARVFP